MEGHRAELAGLEMESLEYSRAARPLQILEERIDHDVSDEPDLFRRNTFSKQVFVCVTRRREQQIGKRIGDYSINLFRHCTVKASKARLDVRQSNQLL